MAGDGRRRHGQDLGGVSQEVSGEPVETVKRSAGHAHEHKHQRRGQAVVAAELLPDGRHRGIAEDRIHPNDEGHAYLAQRILPIIAERVCTP